MASVIQAPLVFLAALTLSRTAAFQDQSVSNEIRSDESRSRGLMRQEGQRKHDDSLVNVPGASADNAGQKQNIGETANGLSQKCKDADKNDQKLQLECFRHMFPHVKCRSKPLTIQTDIVARTMCKYGEKKEEDNEMVTVTDLPCLCPTIESTNTTIESIEKLSEAAWFCCHTQMDEATQLPKCKPYCAKGGWPEKPDKVIPNTEKAQLSLLQEAPCVELAGTYSVTSPGGGPGTTVDYTLTRVTPDTDSCEGYFQASGSDSQHKYTVTRNSITKADGTDSGKIDHTAAGLHVITWKTSGSVHMKN